MMAALLFAQPQDKKALEMTPHRRSAEKVRKAMCESRKFGKKIDQYCKTFRTLEDAVANAAGISLEGLAAVRAGTRALTAPQKKRLLDRFPTIKQL